MSGTPEHTPTPPTGYPETATRTEPLSCPEDVDWILDVDSLTSAGGESFRLIHGLQPAPVDSPHFPFDLTADSASVWNQTIRRLSMASGESHIILTALAKAPHKEVVFYARVAGYRERGLPRIAAVFQKLERSALQSAHDGVWQNWLYLLHEIKNTAFLLKAAEAEQPEVADAVDSPALLRRFAIDCLENHLRNGVLLATGDRYELPNNPAPLDLKLLFERITEAYQTFLGHKSVRVRLEFLCEGLRTVRLDQSLLEQLLNNLLINKEKCLEGQELRIIVEQGSLHEDGSGHQVIVILEDEGPAFPEYVVANRQQELDIGGLMDIRRNSGLGLMIARRIINTLNGDLRFYNDGSKRRILLQIPVS